MQAPPWPPGSGPNRHYAAQFAPIELPSQYQGGGNPNGPTNTGFRYELAEQTDPQITQQVSHYRSVSFPPFSIPTDTESLSSGFPYNQRLSQLRITPDQWHQFSVEVVNAAKLSFSEDAAAWAAGVGTGAASSAFLLFFGPVVGYYTGKSVHKKTIVKKVKEKLAQDGELRNVFRRWNEGVFREKGLQVWLESPTEEVIVTVQPGMTQAGIQREAKLARRFRIMILPLDPRDAPMGQGFSSISPSSPFQGQSPAQTAQGWGSNRVHMKPYIAPVPGQGGRGDQQIAELDCNDGKLMAVVPELPGTPARPFIAELEARSGNVQLPPEIPPKLPPRAS